MTQNEVLADVGCSLIGITVSFHLGAVGAPIWQVIVGGACVAVGLSLMSLRSR